MAVVLLGTAARAKNREEYKEMKKNSWPISQPPEPPMPPPSGWPKKKEPPFS